MTEAEREKFDELFEEVLQDLPQQIHELFEEAPLILEDRPTKQILAEFGMGEADPDDFLCGLYTGTPLTERSFEAGASLPDHIYIFREGVLELAGGWEPTFDDEDNPMGGEDAIKREIRITILHEVGHHFGLDEEDLLEMGYD